MSLFYNPLLNRSIALTILLVHTSALQADVLSFFNPNYSTSKTYTSSLNTFIANDPVGLKPFFNDWEGDFHPHNGTNIVLESSRFDMGMILKDNYYIGYTYRHDVFMEASYDLTRLMYLTKNKLDLPLNEKFVLSLDIDGLEAHGVVLGKNMMFKNVWGSLSLSVSGSLLYATNVQHGTLIGNAESISKDDYNFQADSSYYYTHNYLYDLEVDKTSGFGFSTHVSLAYKYKDFFILFMANDIIGRIYWDNLPYSYISMNSDNKYYDENAYVHYKPSISGIEKTKSYTQKLPLKLHFQGDYEIEEKYFLSVGIQYMNQYTFPFTRLTYKENKNKTYFISHEFRFDTITLGFKYENISLALTSDKLSNASAIGVRMSASFIF